MNIVFKDFAEKSAALRKDVRGGLAVIAAIAIPVIAGAVGAAVDYNRIHNAQGQLDSAVDTATQSVATMLEQLPDPAAEGNRYFNANFPADYLGAKLVLNTDGQPLSISHQKVNHELQVEGYAAADLPLLFGGLIGKDTYHISHKAIVARATKRNVNIVAVTDFSPSMCTLSPGSAQEAGLPTDGKAVGDTGGDSGDSGVAGKSGDSSSGSGLGMPGGASSSGGLGGVEAGSSSSSGGTKLDPALLDKAAIDQAKAESAAKVGTPSEIDSPVRFIPDPNCTKLAALKLALKKFINHVFNNSALESIKIGIVPYNHKLRFPNPNNIPPTLANAEAPSENYYTDFSDAEPLPAIVPLTTDRQALLDAVDAFELSFQGKGWTRSNLGTRAAALMLDPDYHQYFGGAEPSGFDDPNAENIIVIMTDGANTGAAFGEIDGDTSKQYIYVNKADMDDQRDVCAQLKKPTSEGGGNITIFTVVFDVKDTDYIDNESQNISGIETTGGLWIKDVLGKCASNKQFSFDVPATGADGSSGSPESEIEKVYYAIASYLYRLRFVY